MSVRPPLPRLLHLQRLARARAGRARPLRSSSRFICCGVLRSCLDGTTWRAAARLSGRRERERARATRQLACSKACELAREQPGSQFWPRDTPATQRAAGRGLLPRVSRTATAEHCSRRDGAAHRELEPTLNLPLSCSAP